MRRKWQDFFKRWTDFKDSPVVKKYLISFRPILILQIEKKTWPNLLMIGNARLNQKTLKVNRNSYLKMIDGIVYGEDPKQGFIEQNVFYHPVLKFQFDIPQQWAVQNTPEQVQMAAQDNKAMMILTLAPGGSLEAAADGNSEKLSAYTSRIKERKC